MIDTFTFTDRQKISVWKKLNILWWFGNDSEQTVDEATWYHPEWPYWRRWFIWNFIRNPLQNFRAYVIGVQDRNYTVIGKTPVLTVQRNDLQPPQIGLQWCILKLLIPLPFVSYSGSRITWYCGWQPTGFFGVKIIVVL
jgi:hypothetical protein